ncbi:MAG: putative colanic acid biosynthesis acetyltransferase [bacterium]|nr:putative colanic acid biosynthesis acetyltransferase [bacterium]
MSGERFRKTPHSLGNRLLRSVWSVVYLFLFRPSPRPCHLWRRFLLRCFGAKLGKGVRVYPSARIWAPWNLRLDDRCAIGPEVDCYSVGKITIGKFATISQRSVLCTASHDYRFLGLPLVVKDINIGAFAWLCADVFVMPGVTVGEGTVVGVRSTVFRDLPPWKIAFGTPCRVIRAREILSSAPPEYSRIEPLSCRTELSSKT